MEYRRQPIGDGPSFFRCDIGIHPYKSEDELRWSDQRKFGLQQPSIITIRFMFS